MWYHKHSTQVVQELPKPKKIQSLYQWLILVRTDHGLWHTPRIHTRCLPMYLLCLNTVWNSIRITNSKWFHWWSFKKENFQTREKNHQQTVKHHPWKICQRKHHRVPKNFTMVTDATKDRLQNMYFCRQMLQRKSSIISSKCITRKNANHPWLRSENKKDVLTIPHTAKHTFASRSFSIHGPNLCNSLPDSIRGEINYENFKTKLKTHLFKITYM